MRRTLTPAESAVGERLVRGLSNKAIAREIGVSEATVKTQVSAILRTVGADNRTQAAVMLSKGEA